jgi:hypothetical protein
MGRQGVIGSVLFFINWSKQSKIGKDEKGNMKGKSKSYN